MMLQVRSCCLIKKFNQLLSFSPALKNQHTQKKIAALLPDKTHHQPIIRKQIFEPTAETGFYRRRRTLTDDKSVNVSK
ncbi:unnamed protein product, partial [Rotaria socialis]